MTLEDFFTLTEMKDGLTAPARVEELVTVMQKEKDCVVKNVGDATRQWSTVASTIVATENRDCLDLFIQLDGLWFINRWLKDAQKFGNDTSDSFVEESITALLGALEKLHIDNERSISSGIWITVENLLGHNSSRVQDRARALFDSWKQRRDSDGAHLDIEKVGAFRDDGIAISEKLAKESGWPECSAVNISLSKESVNEETLVVEPAKDEILPSRSSVGLQPERIEDVQIQTSDTQISSHITLERADMEDGLPDPLGSSVVSNPVQEKLSIKEESPICPAEGTTSIETCSSSVPKQGNAEGKSDVPKLNECSNDAKPAYNIESSPEKLGVMEISSASTTLEPRICSSTRAADAQESVTEPALQNKIDAEGGDFCRRTTLVDDARTLASGPKSGMNDIGVLNHCSSTLAFKTTVQGGECYSDVLQDSSGNECISGKPEDPETSFSRMEDVGAVDEDKGQDGDELKEHDSDGGEDLANASDFSKSATDTKDSDDIDKRRSDIELEYGLVDALEVARQVAKEVEREVVDYREPFCSSSSEKISDGGIRQPGSPDSINGKQNQPIEGPPKETPAEQNISAEASLNGEECVISKDNLDAKPENCVQDIESSQVTEAAQEPEVDTEKDPCDFDLNEEVCSEDMDRPVTPVSAPISVVSASRAAAVPGLPVAPLQFEGTRGWKGSAATSAFRPASPRKVPDGEKTLSTEGTRNISKQRQYLLDIDLNVAGAGDDKITDLISGKQIPVSSGLPSGESSLEVSPRRSERLKLDLNRISDDGDAPPLDWRMEGRSFYHRNGHRSPSPASSSSSMQPSMRNFDLNDRPSFFCSESSDQRPYLGKSSSQNVNAYGGLKPDDPVISIMGTRVEINRKDFVTQTPSLPNGRALEPSMDANLARTGGIFGVGAAVSCTHSPAFGYNGLTTGPAMTFSSAMYGPGGSIPYMVDSRGAPVVPQIAGSAPAVPPPYSQPPFIMSMTSTPPPGLNGAGPSRPNFDLNSGFVIEGGNRDSVGFRQLVIPGQGRSMEEHLRANSQPSSSSGIGGKRKEPDSGWESYPFNYKYHQPPWK